VKLPRSTHPYIRTHEGWLFLAAVLDLFSRQLVGWSMGARMERELALNALLMAVWRRQPKQTVISCVLAAPPAAIRRHLVSRFLSTLHCCEGSQGRPASMAGMCPEVQPLA
jgi:transposase InsO family protein